MFVETFPVGSMGCNCTILACKKTKEAIICDPGDDADTILVLLAKNGFRAKYLIHTHAHFDHIGATRSMHEATKATICLHREDDLMYSNYKTQLQMFGIKAAQFRDVLPVGKFMNDEEVFEFGEHKLEVIHTPGHTPGSSCFRVDDAGLVLSGDTLFNNGIGRTDLWGGNTGALLQSIKTRLFTLDDDLKVIPGHGPSTQIGLEKRNNPFFK